MRRRDRVIGWQFCRDGKMVLERASRTACGEEIFNKINWYDNADGTVRQLWEMSRDKGMTWNTAFDGHYLRKVDQNWQVARVPFMPGTCHS